MKRKEEYQSYSLKFYMQAISIVTIVLIGVCTFDIWGLYVYGIIIPLIVIAVVVFTVVGRYTKTHYSEKN